MATIKDKKTLERAKKYLMKEYQISSKLGTSKNESLVDEGDDELLYMNESNEDFYYINKKELNAIKL